MTGAPSIDELLDTVDELEPFSVLEGRQGSRTALVCDTALYPLLLTRVTPRQKKRLIPADQFANRTRWRLGAKRTIYFVLSLSSEADQRSALEAQFPGHMFKGFVGDFLTSKSARAGIGPSSVHSTADPAQTYAICCTARAGSTYLCELLGKSFPDHLPYENFRPALVFLYKHRKRLNFNIRHWFDLTLRSQSVSGMFGTKVIGQFLSRLAPLIDAEDLAWFEDRIHALAPKLVYLVREDKVEQSVSQYVARELQLWHLRDGRNAVANQERESEYRQRKQAIAYDHDAIAVHYNGMNRAEDRLQGMLERLDLPVHRVTYEDLKTDTQTTLAGILDFLDMPGARLPVDLSTRIQRGFDSKNAELVAQFRRDLSEKAEAKSRS